MRYPVNYISITQGYHTGKSLDFGWCSHHHQNVYSCDDGVIYKTANTSKGGKTIYIKHDNGYMSAYAHLNSIDVKKGQRVSLGDKIGTMGATGKVTGEHLHFGIYSSVKQNISKADIDPFKVCYLYPNQDNSKTRENYRKKMKIYANKEDNYTKGSYRLLVSKALRKSHNLGLNTYKVKDFANASSSIKNALTSSKPNDNAKFKVGSEVNITEIYNQNGRIWGKMGNLGNVWLVLQNIDGTKQANKIN